MPAAAIAMGGALHASELPYVFDRVAARRGGAVMSEEAAVATLMHRYWVNFTKTGCLDDDTAASAWPSAVADDVRVQIIDADGARHGTAP